MFYECKNLESIDISKKTISIGNYSFSGCISLKSINIPESLISIGEYAFYDCMSLRSIFIPNKVTSIGSRSFFGCTSLESANIPNSLDYIGYLPFYKSYIQMLNISGNGNMKEFHKYFDDIKSQIKTVNINDGIRSISDYMFYEYYSLTSVNIHSNLISIGFYSFYNCTSLQTINIPNTTISIGFHAFDYCKSLESIVLPSSVKWIGDYSFSYCRSLTYFTYLGLHQPISSNLVFYNTPLLVSINLLNEYKDKSFCGINFVYFNYINYKDNFAESANNNSTHQVLNHDNAHDSNHDL